MVLSSVAAQGHLQGAPALPSQVRTVGITMGSWGMMITVTRQVRSLYVPLGMIDRDQGRFILFLVKLSNATGHRIWLFG